MVRALATKSRRALTVEERIRREELRNQIIALKTAGLPFDQIASQLSKSGDRVTSSTVAQLFGSAVKIASKRLMNNLSETVTLELLRLDKMHLQCWMFLTEKDQGPEVTSMMIDRILKIQESRAKYLRVHERPSEETADMESAQARHSLAPLIKGATEAEIRGYLELTNKIAERNQLAIEGGEYVHPDNLEEEIPVYEEEGEESDSGSPVDSMPVTA